MPITNTATTQTTTKIATPEPVLPDLEIRDVNNQIRNPGFVAALPSGEAAVVSEGRQVVKVNNTGGSVQVLYECTSCNICGLLLLGSYLYVTHYNGTIVEIHPHTGVVSVYHIPDVSGVIHYGSLWFDPSFPDPDILLLTDYSKGEVFSYNLTSGKKQVHVANLGSPSSVSYFFNSTSTYYVVCDLRRKTIYIYDSRWNLYSSFQGNLTYRTAAIMSSNNNTLLVSNFDDYIHVFTTEGDFLYHLPKQIQNPFALSYFKPYLWISHSGGELYRYRLDQ